MYWAERFFRWFCRDEHAEIILGDLYETYAQRRQRHRAWLAQFLFVVEVLDLCRPFAWKRFPGVYPEYHRDMLKHYLIIGWRSLWRHRVFSFINISGLALGLACCLLMLLYVQHELSFDRFHADHARIARVWMSFHSAEFNGSFEVTPNIIAPLMRRSFPEDVEAGVRIYSGAPVIHQGETTVREEGCIYADSTLMRVFSFGWLRGDPQRALTDKHSLVLTQSAAQRYFGDADPMGQTLQVGEAGVPFQVTGVMADLPATSHLQFTMVMPFHSLKWASEDEKFGNANYLSYLKLAPGSSMEALQAKLPDLVRTHGGEQTAAMQHFHLQPLAEVYLHSSELERYVPILKRGDMDYISLFSTLALLILLIASINYVNLTTARSVDRAREVGLRKVVGARRRQLVQQFVGETVMVALLALGLGLMLLHLVLPTFEVLVGRDLEEAKLLRGEALTVLLGGGVVLGLLAGVYPALLLSGFQPVEVLRGRYKSAKGGVLLRRGLVVSQFAASVVLIAGALVVHQQLDFLSSKKLGYDKEQVIYAFAGWGADSSVQVLRQQLLADPAVAAVTTATNPPHAITGGYTIDQLGDKEGEGPLITAMMIDEHFLAAMDIELLAGRNFTPQQTQGEPREGEHAFLFNQQMLDLLGLTQANALGQRYHLNGRVGTVQGIVADFHFASLHDPIGPLALFTGSSRPQVLIRLAPGPVASQLARVQAIWTRNLPGRPFDYQFLDQAYAAAYENEEQVGHFSLVFAGLAILIAVLGLLGLAAYTMVQRTKEIGIRRILGAEVLQIVALLSREFTLLVLLALVIGVPVCVWLMQTWLSDFAYHIELGWGVFVLTGLLALLAAWGTVSILAIRSARRNPVEALRAE
jgi:putative ABC transport system permease protein